MGWLMTRAQDLWFALMHQPVNHRLYRSGVFRKGALVLFLEPFNEAHLYLPVSAQIYGPVVGLPETIHAFVEESYRHT